VTDREEAVETLNTVRALEDRTRSRLGAFWQLPGIWALISVGSLPFARQISGERFIGALNSYWLGAIPAGALVSYVVHRRRHVRTTPSMKSALITLAVMILTPVGAILLLSASLSTLNGTAGYSAAAAITLVLAWIARNRETSIISAALFILAGASWTFTSYAPIVLTSVFAATYLGAALHEVRHQPIPR
jgi:uncharacterized membrane protein